MNFKGKVALVTGGAQGLGKAVSKALLNTGMKVLICDIDESCGKSFIEEVSDTFEGKVIYQKCDVSCFEELKAAFNKAKSVFGKIDVVINNAGILNENQWKRMIEVNFIGVVNGIHLAFEFMGTNNGGSGGYVINTSSNAETFALYNLIMSAMSLESASVENLILLGLYGFPLCPVYSGCKHAIVGLTRSYGSQYHLDKTGVAVNAVCPGRTDTTLFHDFPKGSIDEESAKKHYAKSKPISPDDVARAFLRLLQDGKNGAVLSMNQEGMKYVDEGT